jgi:hypothetical protein
MVWYYVYLKNHYRKLAGCKIFGVKKTYFEII